MTCEFCLKRPVTKKMLYPVEMFSCEQCFEEMMADAIERMKTENGGFIATDSFRREEN